MLSVKLPTTTEDDQNSTITERDTHHTLKPQPQPVQQQTMTAARVKFGWICISSDTPLPFIQRGENRYIANHILIVKLLAPVCEKFSSKTLSCVVLTMPKMTSAEAEMFNEINVKHCDKNLVGDYQFQQGECMSSTDDIDRSMKFFDACERAIFFQHYENSLFGFLSIAGQSEVPFIWTNDSQRMVPLFYFEDKNDYLESRSVSVSDKWQLAYLKFCCMVLNINENFYQKPSVEFINVEYVQLLYPTGTEFKVCWPKQTNLNLITPEFRSHIKTSAIEVTTLESQYNVQETSQLANYPSNDKLAAGPSSCYYTSFETNVPAKSPKVAPSPRLFSPALPPCAQQPNEKQIEFPYENIQQTNIGCDSLESISTSPYLVTDHTSTLQKLDMRKSPFKTNPELLPKLEAFFIKAAESKNPEFLETSIPRLALTFLQENGLAVERYSKILRITIRWLQKYNEEFRQRTEFSKNCKMSGGHIVQEAGRKKATRSTSEKFTSTIGDADKNVSKPTTTINSNTTVEKTMEINQSAIPSRHYLISDHNGDMPSFVSLESAACTMTLNTSKATNYITNHTSIDSTKSTSNTTSNDHVRSPINCPGTNFMTSYIDGEKCISDRMLNLNKNVSSISSTKHAHPDNSEPTDHLRSIIDDILYAADTTRMMSNRESFGHTNSNPISSNVETNSAAFEKRTNHKKIKISNSVPITPIVSDNNVKKNHDTNRIAEAVCFPTRKNHNSAYATSDPIPHISQMTNFTYNTTANTIVQHTGPNHHILQLQCMSSRLDLNVSGSAKITSPEITTPIPTHDLNWLRTVETVEYFDWYNEKSYLIQECLVGRKILYGISFSPMATNTFLLNLVDLQKQFHSPVNGHFIFNVNRFRKKYFLNPVQSRRWRRLEQHMGMVRSPQMHLELIFVLHSEVLELIYNTPSHFI